MSAWQRRTGDPGKLWLLLFLTREWKLGRCEPKCPLYGWGAMGLVPGRGRGIMVANSVKLLSQLRCTCSLCFRKFQIIIKHYKNSKTNCSHMYTSTSHSCKFSESNDILCVRCKKDKINIFQKCIFTCILTTNFVFLHRAQEMSFDFENLQECEVLVYIWLQFFYNFF